MQQQSGQQYGGADHSVQMGRPDINCGVHFLTSYLHMHVRCKLMKSRHRWHDDS